MVMAVMMVVLLVVVLVVVVAVMVMVAVCTIPELVGDFLDLRVAFDFVSRLGGRGAFFFCLRERLVETFLGDARFVLVEALELRDMDTHSNCRGTC